MAKRKEKTKPPRIGLLVREKDLMTRVGKVLSPEAWREFKRTAIKCK